MKKRLFAFIMLAVLLLGMLTACGKKSPVTGDEAQKIALEYAGLKEKDVADVHTHIIDQNGIPCYSIHITTADGEVSVIINASTGEVIG